MAHMISCKEKSNVWRKKSQQTKTKQKPPSKNKIGYVKMNYLKLGTCQKKQDIHGNRDTHCFCC